MADALKDFFDARQVGLIADGLVSAWPQFPVRTFRAQASRGLEGLELLDRARHVARALWAALPQDFPRAADVLVASLGAPLPASEGNGMAPFRYLPHTLVVAEHGLAHFDASMAALHALTQRFTAEFAIRPFLVHHQARTLALLHRWCEDPSFHVRRLCSEGTRPRLPWASRLRAFQADPSHGLALLERLKDDPERYVTRSVANHLNDVAKDHPERAVEVAAAWMRGAAEDSERAWVVRHALRSLVKAGHAGALEVLGFRGGAGVTVEGALSARRVRLGEALDVTVTVHNPGARAQRVVVDVAVHFAGARGQARPKVFKGRALVLAPGARETFVKRVAFREMTTRRLHAGAQEVLALVNGRAVPLGSVVLSVPSR